MVKKQYNKKDIVFCRIVCDDYATCDECATKQITKCVCIICQSTFYLKTCQFDDSGSFMNLDNACADCEAIMRTAINKARKKSEARSRADSKCALSSPDAEFERQRYETMGAGIK